MTLSIPHRNLWEAVLIENIKCAVGGPDGASGYPAAYDHVKAEARRWLASKDFEMVCTFAGFDPDMVRDRIRAGRVKPSDFGPVRAKVDRHVDAWAAVRAEVAA